jgi:hypothetical protein
MLPLFKKERHTPLLREINDIWRAGYLSRSWDGG